MTKICKWFVDTEKNIWIERRTEEEYFDSKFQISSIQPDPKTIIRLFPSPLKLGALIQMSEFTGFVMEIYNYGKKNNGFGLNLKTMKIETGSWLPISRSIIFKDEEAVSNIIQYAVINQKKIIKIMKTVNSNR